MTAQPPSPQAGATSEQRADDYHLPAATEQELTLRRFQAHFAFLLNLPMVERSTVDVELFR